MPSFMTAACDGPCDGVLMNDDEKWFIVRRLDLYGIEDDTDLTFCSLECLHNWGTGEIIRAEEAEIAAEADPEAASR